MIKPISHKTDLPPGGVIRLILDDRGMSQKELAIRMNASEKHISLLLNGNVELTRDMAYKLETVLGIDSDFFLNLENAFRKRITAPAPVTQDELEVLKQIPYADLLKQKFVNDTKKRDERVISIRKFFGVTDITKIPQIYGVAYRKACIASESQLSLAAWSRIATLQAQNVSDLPPLNKKAIKEAIPEFRKLTLDPKNFSKKLRELCKSLGIVLVFSEHLKNTGVYGITLFKPKCIIQLSVRGRGYDKFWFSFFHELCHALRGDSDANELVEREIDAEASDILIPRAAYEEFLNRKNVQHWTNIQNFAKEIGIHPSIIIGRLKYEGRLPYTWHNNKVPKLVITRG